MYYNDTYTRANYNRTFAFISLPFSTMGKLFPFKVKRILKHKNIVIFFSESYKNGLNSG